MNKISSVLKASTKAMAFGNILFGGVIGVGVIVSASAEMEARFKVFNKGNSVYDKVKRASIE